MPSFLRTLLLSALACASLPACMFYRVGQQVEYLNEMTVCRYRVERTGSGTVIAGFWKETPEELKIVNYQVLEMADENRIGLWPGTYRVAAFEDLNGDLLCQENEPTFLGGPVEIASSSDEIALPDIRLKKGKPLPGHFVFSSARGTGDLPGIKKNVGTVMPIEAERFDERHGLEGLWMPADFLKREEAGLYFLEEYDPNRIPLLLVHGTGGTPRQFLKLIETIDRKRYQVWYYYYPSGVRLDLLGGHLDGCMRVLQARHRMKEVHVLAYSMGGLIARSFLVHNRYDGGNTSVPVFLSLSTPWGGHEAVKYAQNAPVVIPSWIDMDPKSSFLTELFRRPLGDQARVGLFFGHRRRGRLGADNHDGTVSLRSQLRPEAQAEAQEIHGFDETHDSILLSEEVFAQIRAFLNPGQP